MFVGAIAELCDSIDMLHFVNADFDLPIDPKAFDAAQSVYWETPVNVQLVPMNPLQRHLLRLLLAPFLLKCRGLFSSFAGKTQIAAIESSISRQPDFIFVHRLPVMHSIFQIDRKLPPVFFDLDDVEHKVMFRSALNSPSWRKKISNLIQIPAIFLAECKGIRLSKKTFVCSERDRLHFRKLGLGPNVVVVPNAVNLAKGDLSVSLEKTILFLGSYAYSPNAEAAERLISRVWPLIQKQVGTARLIIAGNFPERIPAYGSNPPNVEFTGLVHDLEELYARSRVICCPIVNGGGTRLKLIEAAAHAKPMVATSIGAEGLSFENEREILICDTDDEIADCCSRLLTDDALSLLLGKSAYQKACSIYNIEIIKKNIAQELAASLNPIFPR
jgi:glycosyltransferase involved in cell wall biosynthesis